MNRMLPLGLPGTTYLSATNTVSAFCAWGPKTLPKNREATVTPELMISSFVATLAHPVSSNVSSHPQQHHSRKVRDVGKEIKSSANAETERAGDLERPHGVLDVVQDIVDIRPPDVRVEDLEHGRGVLRNGSSATFRVYRLEARLTSLLLFELPANAFRKLTCGSWIDVRPESTTHPMILMVSDVGIAGKASRTGNDDEEQDDDLEYAEALRSKLVQCLMHQSASNQRTFITRTPIRGVRPCRSTAKQMAKGRLKWEGRGKEATCLLPTAIPRVVHRVAS